MLGNLSTWFRPSSSNSKREPSAPRPILKRSDSLPAQLPSNPRQRTEVKPDRMPISRSKPDSRPPESFLRSKRENAETIKSHIRTADDTERGGLFGKSDEFLGEYAGSIRKSQDLKWNIADTNFLFDKFVQGDKEFQDILRTEHPDFKNYSEVGKFKAYYKLLDHPKFRAAYVEARNEVYAIPTGPTSSRKMEPIEQKFLTYAFWVIKDDIQKKPFHMHGESSLCGNEEGLLSTHIYSAGNNTKMGGYLNDQYQLHSHPPFGGNFGFSPSHTDHITSARAFRNPDILGMRFYLTDGKDVLHFPPYSTELVKLIPDPKVEDVLGKFPVAFKLPKPEQPPYPFANHEAPAAYKQPAARAEPEGNWFSNITGLKF